MTKAEEGTKTPASEVDSIRKILFGDQVAQMEERFHSIENSIAQLRSENRNLRQALEAELSLRERVTQELREWIQKALKERDEARQEHLAAQAELMDGLQQVLAQYQKRTGPSAE